MRCKNKLIGTLIAFSCSSSGVFAAVSAVDWRDYDRSGSESFSIGDFASAETKFRSALDGCSDKTFLPELLVKYTNALMSQGKFKEASKEMKKCLSLSKSISGEGSLEYGESLDLQAWMYQSDGKMDAAMSSLKSAIQIFEARDANKKDLANSKDLADAYEHMGLICETIGLNDQATDNYSKALTIRKEIAGPQSIEVADLYESLAHLAQIRGLQADAPRMYYEALRIKESRGEAWKPHAAEPTERVVMFRFFNGAPNCKQGTSEGALIEKITGNGITVEVGLNQNPSDFAKTTRALVRIKNESQYDVDVLSQKPTFIQVTPEVRILGLIDAQSLATKIEKKGASKAKWIKFWGADAMTSVTSYSSMQGRGVPPVYGYVPSSFGWSGNSWGPGGYGYSNGYNNFNNNGNRYSGTSYSYTMVPDYQAREEAYRKAAAATSNSKADAESVRNSALGPTTLASGATVEGSLDFDYSKYKSAIVRIPIGNAVFEFRFQ